MEDIKHLLDEEIEAEFENLSSMEPGSDERAKATEDLAKLYKLRIDEIKAETERDDKKAQRKEVILDRCLNIGLQVGLTVGGWLVYDIWHRRGLKFEETGTITSPMTRNLVSRMLPKK